MAGTPEVWGATAIERAMPYPCDLEMMRRQLLNLRDLAQADSSS
jgi:hypothetical protein